jgi:hypothetical protein
MVMVVGTLPDMGCCFTACLSGYAVCVGNQVKQSKLESVIEQTCNMGSGFIIAALAWAWMVAPMIRAEWITIDDPIPITIIFTVVSFARGLFWRRFFNAGLHRWVHRMVTKLYT